MKSGYWKCASTNGLIWKVRTNQKWSLWSQFINSTSVFCSVFHLHGVVSLMSVIPEPYELLFLPVRILKIICTVVSWERW